MTPSTMTPSQAARAARETVLVVPARDRTGVLVTGKDRTTWLNGLVTCELAKRSAGEGAYGLLVEKKGKIQTDLFVVPSADGKTLALALPDLLVESVMETLDHYLIMEDADLAGADLVFFAAHGPRSAELLSLAPFAGSIDLFGTGGAVLAAPAADCTALGAKLAKAAAELGGGITDDATWNAVRIDHGLPRFGVEFDTSLYPQEAALEKLAVSFDKGCYLGQEVVYMLENRGHVKRKLVSVRIEGDAAPVAGDVVTTESGEDVIGELKSVTFGPDSNAFVGLAMVKWAHTTPGTALRIGGVAAVVRGRP